MARSPDRTSSDPLSLYLDKAGSIDLLDAAEEERRARDLVRRRRAWWRAGLSRLDEREALVAAARRRIRHFPREVEARLERGDCSESMIDDMLALDPESHTLMQFVALADRRTLRDVRLTQRRYLRARTELARANLRLVVMIAKRLGRSRLPLEDRVQEGNIGLLKAIDRFDPERGCRLSTYAVWWIRHAVTRGLVEQGWMVRVPAHVHALFTKCRRARTALHRELGRRPTLEELEAHLEVPRDKIESAIAAMEMRSVSLDVPHDEDGQWTPTETLPDTAMEDWADRIGERIDARLVDEVIDTLDVTERDIIVRRFSLNGRERSTLAQIGKDHGLSRERIRQLQNRALRRLRIAVEQQSRNTAANRSPSHERRDQRSPSTTKLSITRTAPP